MMIGNVRVRSRVRRFSNRRKGELGFWQKEFASNLGYQEAEQSFGMTGRDDGNLLPQVPNEVISAGRPQVRGPGGYASAKKSWELPISHSLADLTGDFSQ